MGRKNRRNNNNQEVLQRQLSELTSGSINGHGLIKITTVDIKDMHNGVPDPRDNDTF